MINRNKIQEKDWEILRDNFTDQALDMNTDELADYYVHYRINDIKEDERMDWFHNGVLPCNQCDQFNSDCECDEED